MRFPLVLAAVSVFATACGSSSPTPTTMTDPSATTSTTVSSGATGGGGAAMVCVPGQQVACACPGGGPGAQACNAEGSGYLACVCGSGATGPGGGPAASSSVTVGGGGQGGAGGNGGPGGGGATASSSSITSSSSTGNDLCMGIDCSGDNTDCANNCECDPSSGVCNCQAVNDNTPCSPGDVCGGAGLCVTGVCFSTCDGQTPCCNSTECTQVVGLVSTVCMPH